MRIKNARLERSALNAINAVGTNAHDVVETFLIDNGLTEDSVANDFRGCPPDVQQLVMQSGSLRSTRNPAASLVIRIKNARLQCGFGCGKGSSVHAGKGGSVHAGKGGMASANGTRASTLQGASGNALQNFLNNMAKFAPQFAPQSLDPTEIFLIENCIVGDPVANDLRGCPPEVQQLVIQKGSLRVRGIQLLP